MDTIKTTVQRHGSDQENRRVWRSMTTEQRAWYRPNIAPVPDTTAQTAARILRDHIGKSETYARSCGERASLADLEVDLIGQEIAEALRAKPFPIAETECTHDDWAPPMERCPGCGKR